MSSKYIQSLSHAQRVRLLYKTVLKLHRGLPTELQLLGDNYAKDEFKRHKSCNPMEANLFMREWSKYAVSISEQLGIRGKPKGQLGNTLESTELEHLRDEQVVQLYELMKAAKGDNNN